MSIRSRLAVSYGACVVLTLLIVELLVWWQMGTALRDSLETTLQTRATGILTSLENNGQAGLQEGDRTTPGVFAALFSPGGSLEDASSDAPKDIGQTSGDLRANGRQYLLHVETAPDGTVVVTGADLQPIADTQAALARLLIGVGLSVGAVSLFGGWLLAGRALRPLGHLIDDAATVGPGDLTRRLTPPARMDEVGRLTLTLNGMLDRIAASVEQQRLFVAMASHELRTPLAALRAELDLVERDGASLGEYREAVREAQGDAIRLTGLTSSLLELATTPEDARTIVRAPVRLGELTSAVARSLEPLARQRGVAIELDVQDGVVWVDRTRIEQALENFVSNAIVHGSSGGAIEVRCQIAGEPSARTLTVEVLDRGPGLADEPPDRLFAPFSRGPHVQGPGSGLGLATVARAVRAHGGEFGAANRPGGGARFWFSVPCDGGDRSPPLAPWGSDPLAAKVR